MVDVESTEIVAENVEMGDAEAAPQAAPHPEGRSIGRELNPSWAAPVENSEGLELQDGPDVDDRQETLCHSRSATSSQT